MGWLSLHSSPWWLQNPSTSSLKQRTKAATPTTTPTLHHLQPTLHPLTLHHLLQPILHPPTWATINTLRPPLQPTLHPPTLHHLLQPTLHLRPTPSTESRCTWPYQAPIHREPVFKLYCITIFRTNFPVTFFQTLIIKL